MKTNKRRNLLRWQESRLRRLDYKIEQRHRWSGGVRVPLTEAELNRCCDRAHELACIIQIAWGKREANRQ